MAEDNKFADGYEAIFGKKTASSAKGARKSAAGAKKVERKVTTKKNAKKK